MVESPQLKNVDLHIPENSFITKYIKCISGLSDTYYEYLFATALELLSVAINRKLFIDMAQNRIYPNIWSILLGDSTISRKTTAIHKAKDILIDACGYDRLISNPGSPEALIEILDGQPNGSLWVDEAGQLLKSMEKKYMEDIKDFLCNIYENKNYHRQIRTSKQKDSKTQFNVENPYFTMILATVPDTFKRYVDYLDVTSGWLVRFLYYAPDYEKPYMAFRPISKEDIQLRNDAKTSLIKILEAIDNIKTSEEITLHPDALQKFQKWQEQFELEAVRNKNKIQKVICGRLVSYCLKISMLLHINENPESREIPIHIIDDSINLISNYYLPVASNVIDDIDKNDQNNLQDKFINIIRTYGTNHTICRRDLMRKMHIDLDKLERIEKALGEDGSGELEIEQGQKNTVIYKLKD